MRYRNKIKVIIMIMMLLPLLIACGSSTPRMTTVGVLNATPPLEAVLAGFKEGMNELGYVEGENVTYIYEGAIVDLDLLDHKAQELVAAQPDIILSLSTVATKAVQKATLESEIPVIFVPVTDPVGSGIVPNLVEHKGHITGVTNRGSEERRLEWLVTITPDAEQVYLLHDPQDESSVSALMVAQKAASQLGIELLLHEVEHPEEVVAALAELPAEADAIFMLPASILLSSAKEFITASVEAGRPLSAPVDRLVESGALVSFSIRLSEAGKQSARLADQILQGIPPADLPVETAEFFLTINLQTADAIGLEIPDQILRQADTVIR